MKKLMALTLSVAACHSMGCAIAARSDKFGADLEFGIGGIIGYVADVRFKASVGFSKTIVDKEKKDENVSAVDDDPFGLRHFL